MSIVQVEMQALIAMEQVLKFLKRSQVTEHAVDAIGKVPDTLIPWGEIVETFLKSLHIVVPKQFHRGANSTHMFHGNLDTVMDLLIQNDCVMFTYECGNG